MLWNLIIAYFISAQINAGFCSKSGRNLKLELLSGVVAGWRGRVGVEALGQMLICRHTGERDPRVCSLDQPDGDNITRG